MREIFSGLQTVKMRAVAGFPLTIIALAVGCSSLGSSAKEQGSRAVARRYVQDGAIHVPAFELPLSGFLGTETRAVLKLQLDEFQKLLKECRFALTGASEQDIAADRQCQERSYFPVIARQRSRYNVTIQPAAIAGVATETIAPVGGVSAGNLRRVLINLHGGGSYGGRWGGQIESIPIAAVGKIKVISIDYRLAPEFRFPAASQDIAAVYTELLKNYKPENIGIYGCSSGAYLTAQAMAWFQKEELPLPGAIGLFCGATKYSVGGDSARFVAAINGPAPQPSHSVASYFDGLDTNSALAFPGQAPAVMARFPDALLITSTRDALMSSVLFTHSQLVKLGVHAELHVWEGVGHAFLYEAEFPASRDAYGVIARFFDERLGGNTR